MMNVKHIMCTILLLFNVTPTTMHAHVVPATLAALAVTGLDKFSHYETKLLHESFKWAVGISYPELAFVYTIAFETWPHLDKADAFYYIARLCIYTYIYYEWYRSARKQRYENTDYQQPPRQDVHVHIQPSYNDDPPPPYQP
jgi:hypothetical protein